MLNLKIKLIKSAFFNEDFTKKRLAEFVLQAKQFSMSTECNKFEASFATKQNRKHAVYVNSGSSANLALIQSLLNLGVLKKGDRVGFSAITWSTNVMVLIQLGLVPVAIDCEISTLNISPEKLQNKIRNLDALFLTNVLGFADDLVAVKALCEKHSILLLEDNCESLGSSINSTLLGNFGYASTFSFYIGHHLSTLEGGMICTDDDDLYRMLTMTRAHGWDRNLPGAEQDSLRKKYGIDEFYSTYSFYDLAFNVRPTEINGFIGNLQLPYWDEIVEKRHVNFQLLNDLIKKHDDFIEINVDHMDVVSNFAMPLICRDKKIFKLYKAKFIDSGVEVRPIVGGNVTAQPFYKKYINENNFGLHNADFVHEHGFYFGNNPDMTNEEISYVCELLAEK